jgi:uncharacterized protein (TIGR02453 family)
LLPLVLLHPLCLYGPVWCSFQRSSIGIYDLGVDRADGITVPRQPNLEPVISFLRDLETNNNREWFKKHKAVYEEARSSFEDFVAALIEELSRTEPLGNLNPKDCIFRIHRDLRFTKDKRPYNPYMTAYVAPGGRRSTGMGLYVRIQPGDSMLAGGLHQPDTQQLVAWRASIDRDPASFKRIVQDETFRRYFGRVSGERLKTAPKGYPRDHPEIDLLRLKSVTVSRQLSDEEVLSPGFLREAVLTFEAMKPFLAYLEPPDHRS